MNNTDRVAKDAKILIDSAKDTATSNFLSAVKSNTVRLSEDQLKAVLTILNISLDEGYQKAVPTFQNMVKTYVNNNSSSLFKTKK
jgi:hypothetical protein